jgi:hypothetical protein
MLWRMGCGILWLIYLIPIPLMIRDSLLHDEGWAIPKEFVTPANVLPYGIACAVLIILTGTAFVSDKPSTP